MMEDRFICTDVLVIGGGGAGLEAAIEAKKQGVNVILISESKAGYANSTATSMGWITHLTKENKEKYFRRIIEEGGYLNNQRLVEVFVGGIVSRIPELKELGVNIEITQCELDFPPVREDQWRPCGWGEVRGMGLTKPLRIKAQEMGVKILDNVIVTKLLNFDTTVVGATGVSLGKGEFLVISAKSTILATGGGASIYLRSNNPKRITGDGFILAYQGGAELIDMEFIIFTASIPQTKRKLGLALLKKQLEEATKKLKRNDKRWDFLPNLNAHYFLGGVKIDERCKTSLNNLYAAGEVAGGVFGASRLGGTALADVIIFGAKAGYEAARNAMNREKIDLDHNQIKKEKDRLENMLHQEDGFSPKFIQQEVRSIMWNYAGIARAKETLKKGLEETAKLKEKIKTVGVYARDIKELARAVKAINMIDLAQIVMTAALERRESRGAQWRLDYPYSDNDHWLKNIVIHKVAGKIGIRKTSVNMTHLPSPSKPRIGTGWSGYWTY